MKILLINPPYSRLKSAGQAPYFPLGLGCLARSVSEHMATIKILNLENPGRKDKPFPIDKETVFRYRSQAYALYQRALHEPDHPAWQDLGEALKCFQPDLVGVTVMTVDVGAAVRITSMIKAWNKHVPVIWGGVHPTFEAESSLREPGVDFVIRGEGELAFQAFCEQLGRTKPEYDHVPGLSYHRNGTLIHNQPADLITNLEDYFPPRRDCDLNPERYSPVAWGSIMASRGCPWQCAFCSSPVFWQRRLRYREAGAVFQEIRDLVRQGLTRHFTFWDDSFTANARKVKELCELIIEHDLHITWKTATRIDLIADDLLDLMHKAGCVQLQIGIETGSMRMATLLRKDVDPQASITAVSRIKKHGIASGAFFMAGFHNETSADLDQTFHLMKALDTDEIVLNVFDPMPGSDCFNEMRQHKLFSEPIDWKDFPLWPDRHFAQLIPQDQFTALLEQMSTWIFASNNSPRRKWQKNKAELLFLLRFDRLVLLKKIAAFIQSSFSNLFHDQHKRPGQIRSLILLCKWLFWKAGAVFFRHVPLSALLSVGSLLGRMTYHLDRKRRTMIQHELELLLGETEDTGRLEPETKTAFINYYQELLETFHFPETHADTIMRRISADGYHHLEKALALKRGVIVLTAHFGAHLLPILALKPYGYKVYQLGTPPSAWEHMIGKQVSKREREIFQIRNQLEASLPATFIFLDSSLRQIYTILEQNAVLIIAFDGRGGTKWKHVPVLNRIFRISPGPFHIAYRNGSPIVPVFTVRQNRRNRVIFGEPILLDSMGSRKHETDRAIAHFVSIFETQLRQYPGHYGWLLQAARIRAELDEFPLCVEPGQNIHATQPERAKP
ncbi:radical SAM protein [bacterium]|nr:radical SAM protein [bacterium]